MARVLGVACLTFPANFVIDAESMVPEMFIAEVVFVKEFQASIHGLYMTVFLPVRNRGKSSTVAKSPKKCHLITTMETATTILKEEGT